MSVEEHTPTLEGSRDVAAPVEIPKIKAMIVDANGLIKALRLDTMADKLYTLREVVGEVRDKAAREMLASAPFELVYKEPSPESLRAIVAFAKKTGDFASLSAVDIRVLALTWTVEKEIKGTVEHLRAEPLRSAPRVKGGAALARETSAQVGVVGFATGAQPARAKASSAPAAPADAPDGESNTTPTVGAGQEKTVDDGSVEVEQVYDGVSGSEDEEEMPEGFGEEGSIGSESESESGSDGELDEQLAEQLTMHGEGSAGEAPTAEQQKALDDWDNDEGVQVVRGRRHGKKKAVQVRELADDEGWITPKNIHKVNKPFDPFGDVKEDKKPEVACLTTDFAMQNVLIQMGLPVVSVDGMLIRRAKTFVLRCHACYKVTNEMDKQFCPSCGNGSTLVKISASVDRYGQTHYHTMRTRKTNLRGTRYSLPAPKGGRNANNIILREDQKEYRDALQRQKKWERALEKGTDLCADEYRIKGSPFGISAPHERAQVGHGRRNPNEVKRTGNRKKKSTSGHQ